MTGQRPYWTDFNGMFMIAVSEDHFPQKLTINHGELGCAEVFPFSTGDKILALGDIELVYLSPVAGTVTYSDGEAVAGLSVRLAAEDSSILDDHRGAGFWETTTGVGGQFCLYGMRDGSYKVFFPDSMLDGLWESPVVIRGSDNAIVMPGVRATVTATEDGRVLPEGDVEVEWTRVDVDAGQKWNRIASKYRRFVPKGSRWGVSVESASGGRGYATFSAGASNENMVEVAVVRATNK